MTGPPLVVVANPRARGLQRGRGLPLDALRAGGADVRVRWVEGGDDVTRFTREAVEEGSPTVVAAGGDGTVSGIASVLAGTGVPLGVLPLGTLNHFARDLGVPPDTEAAASIAATGPTRRVDVGRAGDRTFVNTAAFGRWFEVVELRDEWRPRIGKWPAAILAAAVVAVRSRFEARFDARCDGGATVRVPELWIGCGDYALQPPGVTARDTMGSGRMTVTLQHGRGRLSLLRAIAHVIGGRAHESVDVDLRHALSVHVRSVRPGGLRCVLDGEPVVLPPEVEVAVQPGALVVRAPVEEAGKPPG